MLVFDHTLAFPRLIWGPLFLCFVLIGYSWTTLLFACLAMYLLYVVIEIIHVLTSYAVADDFSKARVEKCGWALLGMPFYRLIVFYFRFSGFLATLQDEQKWTASGPVATARQDMRNLRLRSIQMSSLFGTGMTRIVRFTGSLLGTPFFVFLIALFVRVQSLWRHRS
jgi:biofilm PGA synthesis N-glycosyltransferase PgaC